MKPVADMSPVVNDSFVLRDTSARLKEWRYGGSAAWWKAGIQRPAKVRGRICFLYVTDEKSYAPYANRRNKAKGLSHTAKCN